MSCNLTLNKGCLFCRKKLHYWLLFLLLIVVHKMHSQAALKTVDKLEKDLFSLASNYPVESIYIQTSKDIYETEEDVWFKTYVLYSQSLRLSSLNKTLYVQLLQKESKEVVWEEKYEIKDGFVDGHLYLKDSLLEGDYLLVAYTSHSFYKEPEEFYAVKKIKVRKNIQQQLKTVDISEQKKDSLQFTMYPEGGHLVSGIQSKLAFKAVGKNGNSVPVRGVLFENGTLLKEFKSTHGGMGSFDFVPDVNKKYQIQLLSVKNDSLYDLPAIERRGMVLRLAKETEEFLLFDIAQSQDLEMREIYFRLQIKGEVYSVAKAVLKTNLKIKVPLKDLPQGVAEVTLYNSNLEPICERLVYVNHERKLNIKTSISDVYSTREKINLKLKVTDENGVPVKAHLGLSIYDKLYLDTQNSTSIQTHLQLSSQIRGRIYDPTYYFDDKNENRKSALDNLLLTQGWRRYIWSEDNLREYPTSKTPVVLDEIRASLSRPKKVKENDASIQKMVIAYTPEKEEQKEFMMIKPSGLFRINSSQLKLAEGNYLYLRLLNQTDSKDKISVNIKNPFKEINDARSAKTMMFPLPNLTIKKEKQSKRFKLTSDITALDEVTVKGKKSTIIRDKYLGKLDSLVKSNMTRDYVAPCNYINCPVHPYKLEYPKPIEGKEYDEYIGFEWVNESRSAYTIKGIKKRVYRYPKLTEDYLLEEFNLVRLKGYYGEKEFYQPNYDIASMDDSFPDYRNTLLWNPSVITDKNGEAEVSFFCSDINTKFVGTIEGVGEGLLGVKNFEFMVRK